MPVTDLDVREALEHGDKGLVVDRLAVNGNALVDRRAGPGS